MQIRKATNTDIPGIQQVAEHGWHAAYTGILRTETIENVLGEFYSEESLVHSLEHHATVFLVALADEQIVGFIQALPRPGSTDYELTRLYVLPAYQRQGIGRDLLQAVLQQLGDQKVWVLVERDNHAAIAFFQAMHFKSNRAVELPVFGENLPFVEMRK